LKKHVYKIDGFGYLQEVYLAEVDENENIIDEDKQMFIATDFPNNIFKPKWDGEKWIEGETEEEKSERELKQLLESLKPSPEELANAELEIKVLTMLTEMGVIQ